MCMYEWICIHELCMYVSMYVCMCVCLCGCVFLGKTKCHKYFLRTDSRNQIYWRNIQWNKRKKKETVNRFIFFKNSPRPNLCLNRCLSFFLFLSWNAFRLLCLVFYFFIFASDFWSCKKICRKKETGKYLIKNQIFWPK